MFLRGHSTLAETAFRGYRIIGTPANMFMERRLITSAFHRNSSITLQEVALQAPICDEKEEIDFYRFPI